MVEGRGGDEVEGRMRRAEAAAERRGAKGGGKGAVGAWFCKDLRKFKTSVSQLRRHPRKGSLVCASVRMRTAKLFW